MFSTYTSKEGGPASKNHINDVTSRTIGETVSRTVEQ